MIFDYFGRRLQPEFGIEDAIAAHQLVPYDYSFETVPLLEEEQQRWDELSRQLAQAIARNDGVMNDRAKVLARERSKILKSASLKTPAARRILGL